MYIYISENGTVPSRNYHNAVVSAVVIPDSHKEKFKELINSTIRKNGLDPYKRIIRWTKVSPKEDQMYKDVLTIMNNDSQLLYYGLKFHNFKVKDLNRAYMQLIKAVVADFPEDEFRVFVPIKKLPYNYATYIESKLKEDGVNVKLDQVNFETSRFMQCADLVGGAVLFFSRDDQYLEKMGNPGKAAVVEHGLTIKTKPGKMTFINYKEEFEDD